MHFSPLLHLILHNFKVEMIKPTELISDTSRDVIYLNAPEWSLSLPETSASDWAFLIYEGI